jgi:hypothetical protein
MIDPVAAASASEVGDWGRTIATLYMAWYTVFMAANVLALGWMTGREVKDNAALRSAGVLSMLLALLTLGSTVTVGYALQLVVPQPFVLLIVFAAGANVVGLFGVIWAWWRVVWRG